MLAGVAALLLIAVVAAVPLARWLGTRAGYVLAALMAAAGVLLIPLARTALHEPATVAWTWVPRLGAEWTLRVDALGVLFALVVVWVGALVLLYVPRYLADEEEVGRGRFYGSMTAFAAAMTLLVLAGDAFTLYVGWEGTTLTSYMLIASAPKSGRAAALALLVTFAGGLALLGAILLAASQLGTMSLQALGDPAQWAGASGVAAFAGLLVVAAAAKSAQWPFHFWLPAAMVAPTPVSAYLHAAAMVTAGLYLLLRFGALIGSLPAIGTAVAVLGAGTALFASAAALRKDDMKELLAYSTIAHLGFMVSLVGVGTAAAVAGALVYFLAHAGYKAGVFLVAGVYDHALHTRALSGVRGHAAAAPVATGSAALACFSMAGLAPSLGYLGKEEALKGLLHHTDLLHVAITACLAIALALAVAYSIRIVAAPLAGGAGRSERGGSQEWLLWPMLIAPVLLAIATAGLGAFAGWLTPLTFAATEVAIGHGPEKALALWSGLTPAFGLSLAIIAVGVAIQLVRRRSPAMPALPPRLAERAAQACAGFARAAGRGLERVLAHPAPALHLAIVTSAVAVAVAVGFGQSPAPGAPFLEDSVVRWAVCLLIVAAASIVARTHDRLAGFVSLTVVGLLAAIWFVVHGAPHLAAVQLVIDVLALALGLFVLRALSRTAPRVSLARRAGAAVVALAGGLAFAALSLSQRSPALPPAAEAYLESARSVGSGNLVSEILAEYRALDTLGEVAVVAVAALGVVAVLRRLED